MKKYIFVLLIAAICVNAQDYEDISPENTFNTALRSIDVLENSNMVITGTGNTIYLTDDTGKILAKNSISGEEYVNLHEVVALNNETFVAISYSDMLYIFDSDLNYESVSISGEILTDVDFVDATAGFISTASGKVYITSDGGITWSERNSVYESIITAIDFGSKNFGVAAYEGKGIAVTNDGGLNWIMADDSNNVQTKIRDIHITEEGDTYICGSYGLIAFSDDGGMTWETLHESEDFSVMAIRASSSGMIAAITSNGKLLQSINNGESWSESSISDTYVLYAFDMNSDNLISVANAGNVFSIPVVDGETKNLNPMAGIDFVAVDYMQDLSEIGTITAATGGNAIYLKSDDEDEWSELTAPVDAQINDVGYLGGNISAVGSNSMIYFSSDMGENWENTELNEETDLLAVDFAANIGLAGGTNGKLYYRSGSGDWMQASIDADEDINIYDVHAAASSKLIAVGDSGNVYVSTDEGSSWQTYVVNGKTTLLKICSTPSGRIFIGGAGRIYELNDNSIELINSDIEGAITAIYADDASEMLYCASSDGSTYSYNLANSELIQTDVLAGEILDFAWAGNTWILSGRNASLFKMEAEGGNSVASDFHIDEVKVIPNPTSGEFNLVINSEQTYPIDIEIFDVSGKSVYLKSGAYIAQGENQFEISLDDAVGSGNYYVSVKSGNTVISEQLVIIK